MSNNLIYYINKLSYLIVSQELDCDPNQYRINKGDRFFNNCVKRVRQKGCDVLLNHSDGTPIEDPCVTDYGGNWSPITLLIDYGKELEAEGGRKYNELLKNCIQTLEEKQYDFVNDMFKFLLLLKKPFNSVSSDGFPSDTSLKDSDFLLNGMDSFSSFVSDNFSGEFLPKSLSFKKMLSPEESWTKQFDSKFLIPGKVSFLAPEKASLKTIFSSKLMMLSSRTNSDFSEFLNVRNYKSEKSLFNTNRCEYISETLLLDSFVENPINHKLPSINLNSSCKSGFWRKSSVEVKTPSSTLDEQQNESETWKKSSVIELKRNSNFSHSFSILYEKSLKNHFLDDRSEESFIRSKSKTNEKNKNRVQYSTSKEIILGLWEHEQSLIKEFRPELAATFPSLRMITVSHYVEDVKYLFTGISSGTFLYDTEKRNFNMVYGTCLDDVTPESLFHFSKDFMEIGNCYVHLMSAIHQFGKNNFDNCTTVSQVFWKSIFEYLELHYSLVLDIPDTINLMALKSSTRDLHDIIKTVSSICKVEGGEPLPKGGELLTYLLSIAERINNQTVINIVFGILQNCCSVYFMCVLQKWMFNGVLDCESDEFFVEYRGQKNKTKSRSYYNSFYLIDEKVPKFLKGFEESFFNCGKSVHLLKLFNREDKFCQLLEKSNYPAMKLCFSDEELERLEKKFAEYEDTVLKICGPRVTIKQINEEEKEKEKNYQEYVKEFKILLKKQEEEALLQKLEDAKAVKEEQNKLLNEQRSAIDAEKERRKRAEEIQEKEETKKAEEERENLINEEKTLMKKIYDEAMEDLDRQIIVTEKRKESLRKIIETNSDVPVTDSEGNILTTFDENSNSSKLFKITDEGPETEIEMEEITSAQSQLTCQSHEIASLHYDENSNPCLELEQVPVPIKTKPTHSGLVKSFSYRTIASEEAQRNKYKVLKSEFGFFESSKQKPPTTDLERNKQGGPLSECNILSKETSNEDLNATNEDVSYSKMIGLERKPDCTDLNNPPKETDKQTESSSSGSLLSPNESTEIYVNDSEKQLSSKKSSSGTVNRYQDALIQDVKIFKNKSSHEGVFCDLKREDNLNNLPCTNFFKFEKYLRKSSLVALKIQEKLANDALLKHLLRGENLLLHLYSLRAYFFLSDGEFGRSFTHHVFRSLSKCTEPSQFFERGNLSNIVHEALNYSIHNFEQNYQNLSFRIVKMPPFLNHSSHDVLSPFELTYKVDWPLNLILTEKVLTKYKLVFRFLLKLKRINWTLNENFLYLNWNFKSKRLKGKDLVGSSHYRKIQIFRHAMTQMMITLDDYIFCNGIQFPWLVFLKDLETTQNIDQLYQKHVKYIKDVLSRCFLSKNCEDLLDCIHSLIELALKFHYTAKSSSMELVDGKYEHPKFSVLRATFSEFCSVIKTFLNVLKEKISSNEILRCHYVLIEKFDLKLT